MPFRLSPPRDRKLYRLVKKAETIHLVKGRSLYVAGDPARDVFLVRTGFMRLVLPGMEPSRAERTVAVALPWEVFGRRGSHGGTAQVRSGRGVGVHGERALPKVEVLRGLKTAKSSLDAYLEGQEQELHRLRHAQGGSRGPNTGPTARRGAHRHRGRRCGEPMGRGTRLSEKLTHQVLADLAGAHRATVTTLLNDWLYEGVLGEAPGKRLAIRKPADLWVLAGYDPPSKGPPK